MPIRLVLADDHPLLLDGLEQSVRSAGDFEVLARCGDGEEALAAVERHRPDMLVLDLRMRGLDGFGVPPPPNLGGAAHRCHCTKDRSLYCFGHTPPAGRPGPGAC
jgi:hypothetical protein